jgi:hypothetical protein
MVPVGHRTPILTLRQRGLIVCRMGQSNSPPPPAIGLLVWRGSFVIPALWQRNPRSELKVEFDWSLLLPAIFNKQVLSERIVKRAMTVAVLYSRCQKWWRNLLARERRTGLKVNQRCFTLKKGFVAIQENFQSTEMPPSVLNRAHVSTASVRGETGVCLHRMAVTRDRQGETSHFGVPIFSLKLCNSYMIKTTNWFVQIFKETFLTSM